MTKEKKKVNLKSIVLEAVEKLQPLINRRFDINEIIDSNRPRGLVFSELSGEEDKQKVYDIFAELKKEKILTHIAGRWWARLK